MRKVSMSSAVVVYRPDKQLLHQTLASLATAIKHARMAMLDRVKLFIINNEVETDVVWKDSALMFSGSKDHITAAEAEVVAGHGNVGYGRGHNFAIQKSDCNYHLILNPDVLLGEDALVRAIEFMERNPECGLLAPKVFDEQGTVQFLCKRYPTVADLILRGFMPATVRSAFRNRLDRYDMRDVIGDQVVWDVPIVSGCFMLFRRSILEKLKGFSPEYFLYFEDFDLSLRAGQITRTAYVPSVQIVHFGGNAAKKGWRHIGMFTRSAITFFNRHGWKLW